MARDHPVALERITVFDMALPATLFGCPDHEPDRGAAVGGRCAPGAPAWEAAPPGGSAPSEPGRGGSERRGPTGSRRARSKPERGDLRETGLGAAPWMC